MSTDQLCVVFGNVRESNSVEKRREKNNPSQQKMAGKNAT
jgi:hypothetical protein